MVTAPDLFWQSGEAKVSVMAPLTVAQLVPIDCRQLTPLVGEESGFQLFSPDSRVRISVNHRRQHTQLARGTLISFDGNMLRGRAFCELVQNGGRSYALDAEVSPRWIIDSVRSDPPGAVSNMELTDNESEASGGSNPRLQHLRIRLTQPLTPERPLTLLVEGRRLDSPIGQKMDITSMRMLDFEHVERVEEFVSLTATAPYQFQISGNDRIRPVDFRSLGVEYQRLFVEAPSTVLPLSVHAEPAEVTIVRRDPRYRGEILVTATPSRTSLSERYLLRCIPEATTVDSLLVRLIPSRPEPLTWSSAGSDGSHVPAQRLDAAEVRRRQLPTEGEYWDVPLAQPSTEPFELVATREIPWLDATPRQVSLLAMLGAVAQQGRILVKQTGGVVLSVEPTQLPASVLEPSAANVVSADVQAFRYDPARDVNAAGAQLQLNRDPNEHLQAVVYLARVQSQYDVHGRCEHVISYLVENSGRNELKLAWPSDPSADPSQGPDLEVNGEKGVLHLRKGAIVVPLPTLERFVNVQLRYVETSAPLEYWTQVEMPLPEPDVPVLATQWLLWLPQGYDTTSSTPNWQRLPHLPVPWYERLLGPLVRPSGESVFDPLSAESWNALLLQQSPSSPADGASLCSQVVETLGGSHTKLEPAAQQWGALFQQCASRLSPTVMPLLVDRVALEQVGIRATTALPVIPSEADPLLRGRALLERSGLTLIGHESAVVVTSRHRAALLHNHLSLDQAGFSVIRSGSSSRRIEQASSLGGDDMYVEPSRWSQLTPPRWMPGAKSMAAVEAPGWNAFLYSGPVGTAPKLNVYHAPTFRALTWLVLLIMAGLAWFFAGSHPQRLLVAGLALGACVMLLPDLFVSVGTSAVLGLCLGGAVAILRPRATRNGEREEAITYTHWAPVGATLTMILAFGWWQWELAAAEEAPPAYKVFVPIDEEGKTSGNYVVPAALYAELDRRAAELLRQPRYWMLETADYQVEILRENGERRWNARIHAAFDLRVFGHRRRIHIPFGSARVDMRPQQAVLNGVQVPIQWDASGEGFSFDVSGAGNYFLELSLQPMTQTLGDNPGVSLHLPRLATATLEVANPDLGLRVDLETPRGEVRRSEDGRPLTAQLGPIEQLAIVWQANATPGGSPRFNVDEFYWLDVQPGSATLKTHLKFHLQQGVLRHLKLAFDPGLRWLDPLTHPNVFKATVTPGQPNLLEIEFKPPLTGDFELSPRFVLTDTSGVGRVRLPRIEPLSARGRRRWLAVSVDRGALNYREESGTPLELEAAATFMGYWGEGAERPLFAYRLPSGPIDWSLTTVPLAADLAIEQTLAISVGAAQMAVQCEANITTIEGSTLQQQIAVSPDLRVTKVAAYEDERWQPLRWSQAEPDAVTVFLPSSVGNRQLRLEGWVPVRAPATLDTPEVRFEGYLNSAQLQLFRRPGVNVSPDAQGPMQPMAEFEIEQTKAELGRFVAGFRRSDGEAPVVEIQVDLNTPRVVAEQVTQLRYENRRWFVEYVCRLNVRGGLLDVVRFAIPPEIGEPVEVGTPASVEMVELPGQTNRQLVIRPRTSIEGEATVSFRAPLQIPTGEAVAAPDIRMLNAANRGASSREPADQGRWLLLPAQLELRPVSWETRGVEGPLDPPELVEAEDEPMVAYRIVARQFDVRLRPIPSEAGIAQVWLADISLAWQSDGTCQGLACFDVEPAAQRECLLRLPKDFHLVRLTVDGVSTRSESDGSGNWIVPLGTPHLTQRVEVLFQGRTANSRDRQQELVAPMLLDLPVQRTLWTVYGPPKAGRPITPAAQVLSRSEQEMLRARSAASVIGEMTWEGTVVEMARWYRPWAGRLFAAIRAYQQCLPRRGQPQLQVAEIIREQREIATGLDATAELDQYLLPNPPDARLLDLWAWSIQRRDEPLRCAQTEGSGRLTVNYEHPVWGDSQQRSWFALGLAALALVLAVVLRRVTTWEPLRRWPHLLGVVFGLAWWLWLSPSALGLAIVAVSLLAAVVPTFRGPPDPNVVPLRLHRM